LQINFKQGVAWAGSNIYWDGSKLTFKEAGYKGPENYYQGVFFKWGSLVGVSPAALPLVDLSPSNTFNGGTNGTPSTGTPIYVWSSLSSQWIQTNVATASQSGIGGFTTGAGNNETAATAWDRILYTTTGTTDDRYSNYLYANDDFANNRGDICKYIGTKGGPQGYRMAKSIEFGDSNATWDVAHTIGWTRLGTATWTADNTDTSHPGGTKSDISTGGSYQGYPFPASGFRISNSGALDDTGYFGYYWSGSVYNATTGYYLAFNTDYAYPSFSSTRPYGYAVRCVLQE
jgi:hypothetical protein